MSKVRCFRKTVLDLKGCWSGQEGSRGFRGIQESKMLGSGRNRGMEGNVFGDFLVWSGEERKGQLQGLSV